MIVKVIRILNVANSIYGICGNLIMNNIDATFALCFAFAETFYFTNIFIAKVANINCVYCVIILSVQII